MRAVMTNSMDRNIFHGGSLFFIIFVGLSVHSHRSNVTTSTDRAALTPAWRQTSIFGKNMPA